MYISSLWATRNTSVYRNWFFCYRSVWRLEKLWLEGNNLSLSWPKGTNYKCQHSPVCVSKWGVVVSNYPFSVHVASQQEATALHQLPPLPEFFLSFIQCWCVGGVWGQLEIHPFQSTNWQKSVFFLFFFVKQRIPKVSPFILVTQSKYKTLCGTKTTGAFGLSKTDLSTVEWCFNTEKLSYIMNRSCFS